MLLYFTEPWNNKNIIRKNGCVPQHSLWLSSASLHEPKIPKYQCITIQDLNPRSRLLSGGKMFRGDLTEGVRGCPNFGAACSALALKHELLFQVMPDDQVPSVISSFHWFPILFLFQISLFNQFHLHLFSPFPSVVRSILFLTFYPYFAVSYCVWGRLGYLQVPVLEIRKLDWGNDRR